MAATTDSKANGFIFRWKIENVSDWWWLKKEDGIYSRVFTTDALKETKWVLWFYPIDSGHNSQVGIYLQREYSGPDEIEIAYQFAFLGRDGSILKERASLKTKFSRDDNWGFSDFEDNVRVFVTERETFLPEDTLTVQCTIWTTDEKPDKYIKQFARASVKVKRRSFVWAIDRPISLPSGIRNEFRDHLFSCKLFLKEDLDDLYIDVSDVNDSVKYVSCSVSITDYSEDEKENCEIERFFADDLKKVPKRFICMLFLKRLKENKNRYFPNDVLTLELEFDLLTIEHSDCRGYSVMLENEVVRNETSQETTILADDLSSLYNDGLFSDMELRTSTKTFPAHKNILSARSPVLRSILCQDMNRNSGYVDIPDFDDDTIHRMLLYIYTDSLEDLLFENCFKLYEIADKYQILSLKHKCAAFLYDTLNPANVCDVLILSDLHNDDCLKNYVQLFILRNHKNIFYSEKWKDLMRTHLKLAACTMYKKLTKMDLYLP